MASHSVAAPLLAILNPTPLSLRSCRHVCRQSRSKEGGPKPPSGPRCSSFDPGVRGVQGAVIRHRERRGSHRFRTDSTSQARDVKAAASIELDATGTVPRASAKCDFLLVRFEVIRALKLMSLSPVEKRRNLPLFQTVCSLSQPLRQR